MQQRTASARDPAPQRLESDTNHGSVPSSQTGAIREWQQSFRDREVLTRPVEFFFREFERLGLPADALLEGISTPRDRITDRQSRVDWETFRRFLKNMGQFWNDDDFVEAGKRLSSSPWIRPFGLIARLLYSVDELYRWNFRPMTGGSAQFFTCIENAISEHSPGRLSVETWMAPGYRPAPELYRVFHGALIQMPRMVFLKPAKVEFLERDDGSVRYDIELPTGGGLFARMRRFLAQPMIARSMARELEAANDLLFERYAELAQQSRAIADAKEALRESNERFRVAFNSAPTVMVMTSFDGVFMDVNDAFVTTSRYSRDELVGRHRDEFKLWKFPEARNNILEDLARGKPMRGLEAQMFKRNGEEWVAFVSAEATMVNGVPCIIWSAADITNLKQAEEQNRVLSDRIVQAQKLESLGVMAGGIAHDFNNLLVGVLGNAELALSDLDAGIAPSREQLEGILIASQRAADLTQEMLAYAGQARHVNEPMDVAALVAETATLLRSGLPKWVDLHYEVASEPVWVGGDPAQIRQVVMNLIANAAEAYGENKGQVQIRTSVVDADREMLDGSYLDNDLPAGRYAVIRVTDQGCGMSPDTLKRIFEPFFTTKFTGRGLGLAATLGLVSGHGGTLKVHSQEGRGTEFDVFLPLTDARSVEHAHEPIATAGGGIILVIDDEDMVRDVTATMLKQIGYRALQAENGHAGLALVRKHGSDISAVVLDLMMPAMSGDETFTAIRQLEPDIPILCCTGHGADVGARWLEEKQHVGFIQKPFRIQELQQELRTLVPAALHA